MRGSPAKVLTDSTARRNRTKSKSCPPHEACRSVFSAQWRLSPASGTATPSYYPARTCHFVFGVPSSRGRRAVVACRVLGTPAVRPCRSIIAHCPLAAAAGLRRRRGPRRLPCRRSPGITPSPGSCEGSARAALRSQALRCPAKGLGRRPPVDLAHVTEPT